MSYENGSGGQRASFPAGRLLIAAVIALISLVSYFGTRSKNELTGETQHVAMTVEQEIGMGLQAAPEMESQYGGPSSDKKGQDLVARVGRRLVESSVAGKSHYRFQFHLLADPKTINAFALPGGQVFITEGLFQHLKTEGQLAGVLGHEIGHVIERHSAQQLAKSRLTEGLTGAAVVASYDPNSARSRETAAVAAAVGKLVGLRYGRNDELQADEWGVKLTASAGYDPRAMIGVMEILEAAGHGHAPPEFFSTHPNPEHRLERIKELIAEQFPKGVPEGLVP
ncbi:MAG TPA: M48 family metallopeptidase [Pirellulales bacterium]|nr:M48 family metallopeptidase [Pirellulales bacterium]